MVAAMNEIEVGEWYELHGYVLVVVKSKNPKSRTITLIYKGGATKVMYLGAFIDIVTRKLGRISPDFAQTGKNNFNRAACETN